MDSASQPPDGANVCSSPAPETPQVSVLKEHYVGIPTENVRIILWSGTPDVTLEECVPDLSAELWNTVQNRVTHQQLWSFSSYKKKLARYSQHGQKKTEEDAVRGRESDGASVLFQPPEVLECYSGGGTTWLCNREARTQSQENCGLGSLLPKIPAEGGDLSWTFRASPVQHTCLPHPPRSELPKPSREVTSASTGRPPSRSGASSPAAPRSPWSCELVGSSAAMADKGSVLTSVIIFYLSIGAAIFQILEEPNWKAAKDEYNRRKEGFLQKYPCLGKEGLKEIIEVERKVGRSLEVLSKARSE
ncbi:hypothetical protein NFI96_023606 [Prochilodus magdalenae]|nr:hypothetical protein NFI96_023606 [Prochilodus magdalenae]